MGREGARLEVPGDRFAAGPAALSPVRRMLPRREFTCFKATAQKEVCVCVCVAEAEGARRCPNSCARCDDGTRVKWQCTSSSASAGPGARGSNR